MERGVMCVTCCPRHSGATRRVCNGSHETIVLDHQWSAFNQASNGHLLV